MILVTWESFALQASNLQYTTLTLTFDSKIYRRPLFFIPYLCMMQEVTRIETFWFIALQRRVDKQTDLHSDYRAPRLW